MVSEKGGRGALITPSWAELPQPSKSGWRPPVYNGEDYAVGLLWCRSGESSGGSNKGGNGMGGVPFFPPGPPPQVHEMTLRQFTSTPDLLAKLNNDLKHAYPSFVQEFLGPTVDGCSLLLEVLRGLGGGGGRGGSPSEELACLEALSTCLGRSQDASRRLAASSAGLFGVAQAIVTSLNKSRVLALQILRKVCEHGGHQSVGEALSTVRLRFGEPGRFRFLAGVLSSASSPPLLAAGLTFINSFLASAPDPQSRLYIQAELHQAGYNPEAYVRSLGQRSPGQEEGLKEELARWLSMVVDVERLRAREGELSKQVTSLKDKLILLERRLQIMEEEKCRSESGLKSRCNELEREVVSLRGRRGGSSPAEDEGISSSGQDPEQEPLIYEVYTTSNAIVIDNNNKNKDDEETTIEEVMEELQNIINDAETDYKEKNEAQKEDVNKLVKQYKRCLPPNISTDNVSNNKHSSDILKEIMREREIVPEKLHPHPPRKSRNLYFERNYKNCPFFDDEESVGNSDSLLSISNESLYQKEEDCLRAKRKGDERGHLEIHPDIKSRQGSLEGLFKYEEGGCARIYVEAKTDQGKTPRIKEVDTLISSRRKEEQVRYTAERTVFLPIRADPSPTLAQRFVVKRGQSNAGLYSGGRDPTSHHCPLSAALSHVNLSASPQGKLSDLPSGLY